MTSRRVRCSSAPFFTLAALFLIACTLITAPSYAEDEPEAFKFDHFQTGFALEGMHAEIECESCHTRGVFKGTPSQCVDCHTEGGFVNASAKPIHHILSLDTCEDCHTSDEWTFVERVDHAAVLGTCLACHNNFNASGKPANHILVGPIAHCDDCHISAEWVTVRFDHDAVVNLENCFACHDGSADNRAQGAEGKHTQHFINTSNTCNNCHISTFDWGVIDPIGLHADPSASAPGTCSQCHANNPVFNAQGAEWKHTQHFRTSETCDNCHATQYWKPVDRFDHADSLVAGQQCNACHNDDPINIAQGANGKRLSPDHPTTSDTCDICHVTASWSMVRFEHEDVKVDSLECSSCHIPGGGPDGRGTPKHDQHFQNTSNTCDNCHISTMTWNAIDSVGLHADPDVETSSCFQCHSGDSIFEAQGARGQHPQHIPASNECDACHSTNQWQLFSSMQVTHDAISGVAMCTQCHIANSPFPISFGDISHKGQAGIWHTITGDTCVGCHEGAPSSGWVISESPKIDLSMHGEFIPGFDFTNTALCGVCHGAPGSPAPSL